MCFASILIEYCNFTIEVASLVKESEKNRKHFKPEMHTENLGK